MDYLNEALRQAHAEAESAREVVILPSILITPALSNALAQRDPKLLAHLYDELRFPLAYTYLNATEDVIEWLNLDLCVQLCAFEELTECEKYPAVRYGSTDPVVHKLPKRHKHSGIILDDGVNGVLLSFRDEFVTTQIQYQSAQSDDQPRREFFNEYCLDCPLYSNYQESIEDFAHDICDEEGFLAVYDTDFIARSLLDYDLVNERRAELGRDLTPEDIEALWNESYESMMPDYYSTNSILMNIQSRYHERSRCSGMMSSSWMELDECPEGNVLDDEETSNIKVCSITLPPHNYGYGHNLNSLLNDQDNQDMYISSHAFQTDAFGNDILLLRALRFFNVYGSGRICFGDNIDRHGMQDAIEKFWCAYFNSDLEHDDWYHLSSGVAGAERIQQLTSEINNAALYRIAKPSSEEYQLNQAVLLGGEPGGRGSCNRFTSSAVFLFPVGTTSVELYGGLLGSCYPIIVTSCKDV